MKPGWQTSEFWVTAATAVITVLALLLHWPREKTEAVAGLVGQIVVPAFALVANAYAMATYVNARTVIKVEEAGKDGEPTMGFKKK